MNEIYETLFEAKIDSRALTVLVDTILDNCYLSYSGELTIDRNGSEAILAVVKAFRAEELTNRYNELKELEAKEKEEA